MTKFETLELHEVGGLLGGPDGGPVLTYWNDWIASENRTTQRSLLQNHDGDCVGWTHFFLDIYRAQGITGTQGREVQSIVPGGEAVRGAVDTGRGPEQQGCSLHLRQLLQGASPSPSREAASRTDVVQVGKAWNYAWVDKGITFDPKSYLLAQGESTQAQPPLAYFDNHVVAQITLGGRPAFFDPSYGRPYLPPKPPDGQKPPLDVDIAALRGTDGRPYRHPVLWKDREGEQRKRRLGNHEKPGNAQQIGVRAYTEGNRQAMTECLKKRMLLLLTLATVAAGPIRAGEETDVALPLKGVVAQGTPWHVTTYNSGQPTCITPPVAGGPTRRAWLAITSGSPPVFGT